MGEVKLPDDPEMEDWLNTVPYIDYAVTCDRCGIQLMAHEAIAEEGDEWECAECWERCNNKEREEAKKC